MFHIEEMTEEAAQAISKWKYPSPYEIYSFSESEDEIDELKNGLHFAVYPDETEINEFGNEPCGFAAFGWSAQIQDNKLRCFYDDESYTDIAFGLRPELCGKGMGQDFVKAVIDFVKEIFGDDGIRLTVDTDNKRACTLYERMGFKEIHAFNTKCVDAAKGRTLSMKIMVL